MKPDNAHKLAGGRVRKWARAALLTCLLPSLPALPLRAQNNFVPQGNEYPVAGTLPGDQVFPDVSLKTSGGFLVWQDNATDGSGLGISAQRLDSSLSATLSSFRVNQQGAFDQERPRVALLNGGGAVFVWQGGPRSAQRIYSRFLSPSNTWATDDVLVNTFTNHGQLAPVVATLTNNTVAVIWCSFNQVGTNTLQDIFAQRFTATGQKLGGEFSINQFTTYNQRTPSVAALSDGRFVVVWISEQQSYENSVEVYARLFNANGTPAGSEFRVNAGTNVCANPSVASSSDGGFAVAWGEKDLAVRTNGWDVYARAYSNAGIGGSVRRVNTEVFGDQFAPRLANAGTDYLAVWTSMGQDGSWEGVYGQFLNANGSLAGGEFCANTTTASRQIHPAVASDGIGRFLVSWSGFVGLASGMDLFAQRYESTTHPLLAPDPPFVTVLSSNALSVTWPEVAGFNVDHYEVFADGAATATASVTNNSWKMTGLAPASTHSFRLAFVLTDGRRSPLSGATANTTYGPLTYGGIPYEWMVEYFGGDLFNWPSPFVDSDGDGVNNRDEFLAGTDPTDPNSVLRIRPQPTPQGFFVNWNTQPGLIYQVQSSTDLDVWVDVGGPRFAAGSLDSIYVGGGNTGYYRVLRLR